MTPDAASSFQGSMATSELDELKHRVANLEQQLGSLFRDAELAVQYASNDPDGAATKAGRAIEGILFQVYRKEIDPEVKGGLTIEQMKGPLAKFVPPNISAHIDIVQRFRNTGAHHRKTVIESDDISVVLQSFLRVVDWYAAKYAEAGQPSGTVLPAGARRTRGARAFIVGVAALSVAGAAGAFLLSRTSAPTRAGLDVALATSGEPGTPAACQCLLRERADTAGQALHLLAGGRPGDKREASRQAVQILSSLAEGRPPCAELDALRARAGLFAGDDPSEVVALAGRANSACPDFTLALATEGTAELLAGNASRAMILLSAAVRLSPEHLVARFNLALAQLQAGFPQQTLGTLEPLAAKEPFYPGLHVALGQAKLQVSDFAGATVSLKTAVVQAPESGTAHLLLGRALEKSGRPSEARQAYCRARDLGIAQAAGLCSAAESL